MKTLLFNLKECWRLHLLSVSATFLHRRWTFRTHYDLGVKSTTKMRHLQEGGTLVVATNDGLVGLKPGTNELLFNHAHKGC
jgi:hypothetical protein